LKGSSFDTLSLVDMQLEDKWILSKLNNLVKKCHESLETYELHEMGREIINFVINDLSRNYIQFIRDRFSEESVVTSVLSECLYKVCLLLAPITPFTAEKIYLSLKDKFEYKLESIHLGSYPKVEKLIDENLEKKFFIMQGVIEGLLAAREEVGLGIRWPLKSANIYLYTDENIDDVAEVIKRQCNVKAIKFEKVEKNVESKVRIGSFNEGYVTIDASLTPSLELEGYTREIIRRVQRERKTLKLVREDKIQLYIDAEYDLSKMKEDIAKKVGAEIIFEKCISKFESGFELKVKGKNFGIWIIKL